MRSREVSTYAHEKFFSSLFPPRRLAVSSCEGVGGWDGVRGRISVLRWFCFGKDRLTHYRMRSVPKPRDVVHLHSLSFAVITRGHRPVE